MIKRDILQYIEKENLFSLQDKVLVALSGGADSIALLRLLLSAGYMCEAAHCNFYLRAEESDRDEAFVRQLCTQLQVTLHVIHFDTCGYAKEKNISIEMAARELRYQWFSQIKESIEAQVIAVAHHRDDSAETMLLNLIRGTGIHGLLGIQPRNGDIVRPLLNTTRQEIIHYLQSIGQKYVTDSTNLQDEYTRNKIRLKLIPLIEEINPSIKESLSHTAGHLNEVHKVYRHAIDESIRRVRTTEGIYINRLLQEASPQAVLFEILHPLGFNSSQINDILHSVNGQSGKQFTSKTGYRVVKDRELLYLTEAEPSPTEPPFSLTIREVPYTPDFMIPRDKHIACFDSSKLKESLNIRKWQAGDEFYPFGMKGKKKISDYLTDRKFSITRKEKQWLLCEGENIIWVVGERTDNRYRIDSDTQKVTIISIEEHL